MTGHPSLIAIDVDGTLVDDAGDPSARTIAALELVRAAEIPLVIATGRPWMIVERTIETVGGADYAVCSNGARTVRVVDGEVLGDVFLPDGSAESVVTAMRSALPGIGCALEFGLGAKSEEGWARRLPAGVPLGRPVDDVLSLLDRGPIRKVMIWHDDFDDDLQAFAAILEPHLPDGSEITASGLPFLEVGIAGLNKSVALDALCSQLAIDVSGTVAFGDEHNDIEMLRWAGTGLAMGNAADQVKAAADRVTLTNVDEGVAYELETMLGAAP